MVVVTTGYGARARDLPHGTISQIHPAAAARAEQRARFIARPAAVVPARAGEEVSVCQVDAEGERRLGCGLFRAPGCVARLETPLNRKIQPMISTSSAPRKDHVLAGQREGAQDDVQKQPAAITAAPPKRFPAGR